MCVFVRTQFLSTSRARGIEWGAAPRGGPRRRSQAWIRGVKRPLCSGSCPSPGPGVPGAGWGWDKGERPARGLGRWDLCVSWGKVKEKLGSQQV